MGTKLIGMIGREWEQEMAREQAARDAQRSMTAS